MVWSVELPLSLPHPLRVQVHALQSSLQSQRWTLGQGAGRGMAYLVQLSMGRGRIEHAEGEVALHPSDIVWLPVGSARQLHLQAGAAGLSLGIEEALLAQVLAGQGDAPSLRRLVREVGVYTSTAPERTAVVQAMAAMARESQDALPGHASMLTAYLTQVLVGLWRMARARWSPATDAGSATQRLLQFRQLVETQFRHHWPVARYAQALGISADGLHDLCMRNLQKTPLSLVHQRLAREAATLLSGTELAVQALADELGFASASHFSHFFKRWSGQSPMQWRQWTRQHTLLPQRPEPFNYADWP
jgi:AraC-like DNA-binding protein